MDDEKNFQIFIDEITREQDKEENRLCDIRENKGFKIYISNIMTEPRSNR